MLKVSNLRKEYDTVVAVDGVSLEVNRGELFGLLGPNGAGKTTTIRTLLNIIQPDSGEITFDGRHFNREIGNSIGYLPEERGLYRKSKVINTILYFASLKGLAGKQAKSLAFYWLDRFGLKNEGHRKIEELSKGNQQKVQLIISIIHRPQLLILDEPFSGLDPVNQVLLKDVLLELRQNNIAIIFSTHQMEQVEKLCDNICLINKGRPVLSGELHEIKKRYGTNSVHLEYEGDGEFLKNISFIRQANIYQNYAELELTDISKSSELLASLNGRLSLRKYEIVEPSLNSIFINVVGGPESIQQASEKSIPDSSSKQKSSNVRTMQDGRMRKALLTFVVAVAVTLGLSIFTLLQEPPQYMQAGILIAVTVFIAVRFFLVKKKVERELSVNESQGKRI